MFNPQPPVRANVNGTEVSLSLLVHNVGQSIVNEGPAGPVAALDNWDGSTGPSHDMNWGWAGGTLWCASIAHN